MSSTPNVDSALDLAAGSAVFVVIQYDCCDWSDFIMQPAYRTAEQAEKRAARLRLLEDGIYTYHVKKIQVIPSPNGRDEPRRA